MLSKSLHTIYKGDVYGALHKLDDNSIDCAITSPPYWSQRDYGFENQIGNEETLEEYFEKMVSIYSLLRTKINNQGVFFHNIGDKYINKYGNTPLGMIPYKLAYFMVQEGWILEDIIIWYKPNHMPSSVKNRFTNTYEPVFVFAKSPDNYYSKYKKLHESRRSHKSQKFHKPTNILKIVLQTITYAHMATFPEKLVESLLDYGIPENGIVLDPFGGAGTTCKAVQTINKIRNINRISIMIEAQPKFVDIILERCNLKKEVVIPVNSISYKRLFLTDNMLNMSNLFNPSKGLNFENIDPQPIIIKHLENHEDFEKFVPNLFNNAYLDNLNDDGLLFLILPDHNIETIYALTKAKDWVIRNMIVVPKNDGSDWIPLVFLVKDTKMVKYQFNIDNIRINHLHDIDENWETVDFLGYKVIKSQVYSKFPQNGIIIKVIDKKPKGLPNWVGVKWDDGTITVEEVINPPIENKKVTFTCPHCNNVLRKYHFSRKKTICNNCNQELWKKKEGSSIPKLELNPYQKPSFIVSNMERNVIEKDTKRIYNGKFKDAERINMGQSPGARISVSEQFFSMQRYYNVKQSLFCDYLNIHREKVGLTKNDLAKRFPSAYKHTVGHWLRKDMGGSLPKVEDLLELQKILDLEEVYVNYSNRFGLKLQTVIPNKKGKNPGDFLALDIEDIKKMFEKLIS